jgi:hypothetical protein
VAVAKIEVDGHPAPHVLMRLEDFVGEEHVLRTDEARTIEVVTDEERIWITPN